MAERKKRVRPKWLKRVHDRESAKHVATIISDYWLRYLNSSWGTMTKRREADEMLKNGVDL